MEIKNDELRKVIAKMIWWDHFAHRVVSERWDTLDDFLGFGVAEVPDEKIISALVSLGYEKGLATKRTMQFRSGCQEYQREQRRNKRIKK